MRNWVNQPFIDVHCHLLPGVDDGARNKEEALRMLAIAKEEGISHIFLTPHVRERRRITEEDRRKVVAAFTKEAREAGYDIPFSLGNEVYYSGDFKELLQESFCSTMNGKPFVLLEFGFDTLPVYMRNVVMEITAMGKTPIIAHVERYFSVVKNPETVTLLRGAGALIQVNVGSITGALGHGIRKFTKELLRREEVDFLGTDAHDSVSRTPRVQKCLKYLYGHFPAEYVRRISYENAKELLL